MGYQVFGKVKTMVLPITDDMYANDFTTLEKYKNDTGIDLTELFYLDNDSFRIKKVWANSCLYVHYNESEEMPLVPVVDLSIQRYISGSQDAYLHFLDTDGNGIALQVGSAEEFKLENVMVWIASSI